MAQGLLVDRQIDAGRDFLSQYRQHFPVSFAFWIYSEERPEGQLFLVSDESRESDLHGAYRTVVELLPWRGTVLDADRVKLLASRHPVAQQIAAMRCGRRNDEPFEFSGMLTGYDSETHAFVYEDADGRPGWNLPAVAATGN